MTTSGDAASVLVFYIDSGGGHRNAARALVAAAQERGSACRLEMVNLQSVLASLDFTRRFTGVSVEEAYNVLLRREWTSIMVPLLRLLHGVIRLRRRAIVRRIESFLAERQPPPAALLSVMPNFNGPLRDACRRALPGVRLAVLMTDLADFPPHFWLEPGLDCAIVATDEAERQAAAVGLAPEAVVRTSGMVLHPRHYAQGAQAGQATRAELGFGVDDFVVLLLFGGKGSPVMERLASGLLAERDSWRVIAISGDNPGLVARLEAIAATQHDRLRVLGFTDRVGDFMAASDLLVTKPGPGSLAEAFHRRVAVVVAGNRDTIPQERFNVRLVAEGELGVVVSDWAEVPAAVSAYVADPERQRRVRANLAALPENRAVFEALDVIEQLAGLRAARP
jgi:1,2-diacylglycerol 3-beta-galactosyltransferase